MAIKAILDTRFFFALYNPSSRNQEDWCRSVVLEAKSPLSTYLASCITIAELYENMGRIVGKDVLRLRISSIKNSGIGFIPINEDISEGAGDLRLNSGQIPMSDAIISVTARLFAENRVFSDDPHFKVVRNKVTWVE